MNWEKIKQVKEREFETLRKEVKAGGDEKAEIRIYERRFNLMGAEYWTAGFLYELEKIIGEGAVGILYNSGSQIGRIYYEIFKKKGIENRDEQIGRFLGLLKFCGYGEIELRNKDEGTFSVILKNSPDAFEYKEIYKKKRKVCHYLRGIFNGFLSSCLKQELKIEETKCMANGDAYCEFKLNLK